MQITLSKYHLKLWLLTLTKEKIREEFSCRWEHTQRATATYYTENEGPKQVLLQTSWIKEPHRRKGQKSVWAREDGGHQGSKTHHVLGPLPYITKWENVFSNFDMVLCVNLAQARFTRERSLRCVNSSLRPSHMAFSHLVIRGGGPRSWWAVPTLADSPVFYKKDELTKSWKVIQ